MLSTKPWPLYRHFRNDVLPNVAVTVDLLTTGIDVSRILNLVFIRQAALGDPLQPYEKRVDAALEGLLASRDWTRPQAPNGCNASAPRSNARPWWTRRP